MKRACYTDTAKKLLVDVGKQGTVKRWLLQTLDLIAANNSSGQGHGFKLRVSQALAMHIGNPNFLDPPPYLFDPLLFF